MIKRFKLEIAYPVLAIITLIIIALHHYGMNKTLNIYPDATHPPITWNDDINEGISKGIVTFTESLLKLDCTTIKTSYTFAFCGMMVPISKNNNGLKGINLDSFESLDIEFEFRSDQRDTVIIYLLNTEENSRNPELPIRRANSISLYPKQGNNIHTLQLDAFSIPSWWLFSNANVNEDLSITPQMDNITDIQITTGDNAFERKETIIIKRLLLTGKLIKQESLYLFLLSIWLVFIMVSMILGLKSVRSKLAKSNNSANELRKINKFLSVEKSRFESMAKYDPLTNTYNRMGISDILYSSVQGVEKHGIPCSLIMIDIDNFKAVNDTYGHESGDIVLKNLVKHINENSRNNDHLARWGGEEFVVICENTSFKNAIKLAQKYCDGIAQAKLFDHQITCSFGVSEFDSNNIECIFKKADDALYRAKHNGRNQVAF